MPAPKGAGMFYIQTISALLPRHAKTARRRFSCAEGRARTGDPFLFREMLYQLSYLGIHQPHRRLLAASIV